MIMIVEIQLFLLLYVASANPSRILYLYVASACHPNPCQNDGACLRFGTQSFCQCKTGYSGKGCEGMKTLQFYFSVEIRYASISLT